ncbi:FadR/GntR family transcriptional regulator [Microbacterium sp. GXS0129]|uniref:FadR/GntR family transcriptional regulator n=1 Tax=Microbacterium sp. GXS0129 TaxID=3377836 RepID=UPI00383BE736
MGAVDTALRGLRVMIADGTLRPGDRLPSEGELSDRLGVARGSIREATRMLAAFGVVETRHGSGTYVGSLTAADVISSMTLTVGLLPLESVIELYELRKVLDAHAASLAAARHAPAVIEELAGYLDQLEGTDDDDVHSVLDHSFHMRIAEIAGVPAVEAMLGVLRSRSRSYRIFESASASEIKRLSNEGHRAILDAIARRDAPAAAAAAVAHAAQTEHWLRQLRPPARANSEDMPNGE